MTFAVDTSVSVEKSRAELDRLLQKHGATQRVMGTDELVGIAVVGFTMEGRQIRLQIPLPKAETFPDPTKASYNNGKKRTARDWDRWTVERRRAWVLGEYEQACRTRWRAIVLVVKAKLELIAINVSTVEREFLADISLPNGRTVHDLLKKQIEQMYLDGTVPSLLLPAHHEAP